MPEYKVKFTYEFIVEAETEDDAMCKVDELDQSDAVDCYYEEVEKLRD